MTRQLSHISPAFSYWQALNLFILETQPPQITTVKQCTTARFAALVQAAIRTSRDPEACALSLAGLDYHHHPDRWYSILLLRQYRARAFWYEDKEQALAILGHAILYRKNVS